MFYDEFVKLCNSKEKSPTAVAKEIGLAGAHVTKWKKGSTPTDATTYRICDYFGLPHDYFQESPIVRCADCGLQYNLNDPEEVDGHKERHQKWERAVNRFGFCWSYVNREKIKADARNKLSDSNRSIDEHAEAQIDVFKALFSRSLESCEYSLSHVSFEDYVAMLLKQDFWKSKLPLPLYERLSAEYGVCDGIPEGTYYSTKEKAPTTESGERTKLRSVARLESADLTPEMDKHIEEYIDFVLNRNKGK